jgi:hypothetical protein
VSATAYTLLGVVCKLISVILNVVIWDKHASPRGMLWLLVCLVCSAAYKQASLRTEPAETPRKEFDEENSTPEEMKCIIGHETETDEEDGGGSTDAPPPSSNTSEESC